MLRAILVLISTAAILVFFAAFGALIVYLTEEEKFDEEDRAKRDIHTES